MQGEGTGGDLAGRIVFMVMGVGLGHRRNVLRSRDNISNHPILDLELFCTVLQWLAESDPALNAGPSVRWDAMCAHQICPRAELCSCVAVTAYEPAVFSRL